MSLVVAYVILPAMDAFCGAMSPLAAADPLPEAGQQPSESIVGKKTYDTVEVKKTQRRGLPDIVMSYPQFGVAAVDKDIAQWCQYIAASFERDFSTSEIYEPSSPLEDARRPVSSLSASFTVSSPSCSVVSLVFSLWMCTVNESAAFDSQALSSINYSQDVLTLNYNLDTGQRLHLVDIFEDAGKSLAILSQMSRTALARSVGRGHVDAVILRGTEPEVENFSSLALTSDGVRVYFQPYQVSTLAGSQAVDVPLEALLEAGPMLSLWGRGK